MTPPSLSPVEAVAPLFQMERARLLELLRGLRAEDWQRPTPCPGWSVLDLANHLLGNDVGLISRRRDGYLGTPRPDGLAEEEFIDWLDELQMGWVRASRRISPQLVVELLEWTGDRLIALLGGEDLTERSGRVSWAGPDPAPRWLDQLRELSECWIHRQQLLEAVGETVDLDPSLLRPILLGLRWAWPYRLSNAEVPADGVVRIDVGEPIDALWTLVATGGAWEFADATNGNVIAHASFTADQAWRLLTNNLREPPAALEVTGDEHVTRVIVGTRAIIGHPA